MIKIIETINEKSKENLTLEIQSLNEIEKNLYKIIDNINLLKNQCKDKISN